MSHVVQIRTEVRDRDAVHRACRRLALAEPVEGEAKVFTTQKRGTLVRLKDWEFPIVCRSTPSDAESRQRGVV